MYTLYSFRRCPYAIRCRMVLHYSQVPFRVLEISLKDKPKELLQLSQKERPTVPVLYGSEFLLEESWDIMKWALERSDPENWWSGLSQEMKEATEALRAENDGFFKQHLDRYKYSRGNLARKAHRHCVEALAEHEQRLQQHKFLLAERPTLADIAIMSFVRQFAAVKNADGWLFSEALPHLHRWLEAWKVSALFQTTMAKGYNGRLKNPNES